jgi:hypothetical protein
VYLTGTRWSVGSGADGRATGGGAGGGGKLCGGLQAAARGGGVAGVVLSRVMRRVKLDSELDCACHG